MSPLVVSLGPTKGVGARETRYRSTEIGGIIAGGACGAEPDEKRSGAGLTADGRRGGTAVPRTREFASLQMLLARTACGRAQERGGGIAGHTAAGRRV